MRIASIISDPKRRRVLSYKIISFRRKLAFLLYFVGLVWLLLLPTDELSGAFYVDENALMPGMASNHYNREGHAIQMAEQLKHIPWNELPQWTISKLAGFGMETFTQNFTAKLPLSLNTKLSSSIEGVNWYSILRAEKTSSTEAIVLAVMVDKGNLFSLAVLVSLAEYLSTQPFWAKDIIFLATNGGQYGMQAWLEAYLGIKSSVGIAKDNLATRSGIIQAAVVLDITSPAISHVSVLTNGINGQLSNQDIANAAVMVLHREMIPVSIHGQESTFIDDKYRKSLKIMLKSIGQQATGLPEHLHGLFVRYHIDAVTFKVYSKSHSSGGKDLGAFGRTVEGQLRCINNLLEPLHHSMFFYLSISTFRYISISLYFPPLACIFVALALEGFAQWLLARDPELRTITDTSSPTVDTDAIYVAIPVASVLQIGITVATCGYLVYASPMIYSNLIGPLTPSVLLYCVVGSVLVSMVTVPFVRLASPCDWHIVKFFYLLLLITALLGIGLLNFSLSLIITVGITVPCLCAAPSSGNRCDMKCLIRVLATLLLSPVLVFFYCCVLHVYTFVEVGNDYSTLLLKAFEFTSEGLTELYLSSQVLGSWVYVTICVCVWPLWLVTWSLNFQ
ncbi:glycosylphosphatidylinositol anchor attachment 1 protein-like [Dysidea avara]|uniref:glycosylphosphatidylinositol anchor attachment 1 protein-like n=1 Tax=Dysidea avara TaxID=196820 RepID=UPI003327A70A